MNKPLITLTVIYILVIVLLETIGALNKIPINNIARLATGDVAVITGRIISEPEETVNKISFIIKATKINGNNTKGNVLVSDYVHENNFCYGDIVEITGKFDKPKPPTVPGTFDYEKYLSRKRIYSLLSVFKKNDIKLIDKKPSPILQLSLSLKQQILDSYKNNLSPQQTAVLSGITIGEKSQLTPYIQKIFMDAGVMHVLVASGSNVAFVTMIFFWVFRYLFRLSKKIATSLLIPIALLYAMVAGANPPILRATIMTLVVVFAMLLSKNTDIYHNLFLAMLIILIYNPLSLFEAGFQMSFAATFGIVYFFPKFQSVLKIHKFPKLFNWLTSVALVSISAQIAITPLLAYYFNKMSIIALISNVVILPMVGLCLGMGFALYFTSLISIQLLFIVSKITGLTISLIIYLVDMFANVPHSTIRVATPSIYFIALFYIITVGLPKVKNYVWRKVVVFAVVILIFLPIINYFSRNKKNLEISFIDVGLGDAIFCKLPDGSNMLIDGGGNLDTKYDIGETVVSPFLWNRGIMKIDTIVLTHPHTNHYQGLIAVCNNFMVKKIITTTSISNENEYLELMKVLRKKRIYVKRVSAGEHFANGNISVDILNPKKISYNTDDNSVVMKLSYNDFNILFCGDITNKVQNILSMTAENIASTFLVVPRHGKKKLSANFLLSVSPKFAIMSTNKPSSKVVEQLRQCRTFSTNAVGTVTVVTNGREWKINKEERGER